MYAGRVIEEAPAAALFDAPAHPYTNGLLAALPDIDGPRRRLEAIPGAVPAPHNLPPGCAFAPRCSARRDMCDEAPPRLREVPGANLSRRAACERLEVLTAPLPLAVEAAKRVSA